MLGQVVQPEREFQAGAIFKHVVRQAELQRLGCDADPFRDPHVGGRGQLEAAPDDGALSTLITGISPNWIRSNARCHARDRR